MPTRMNADFGRFFRREFQTVGGSADPEFIDNDSGVGLMTDVGAFLARTQCKRWIINWVSPNPIPIGLTQIALPVANLGDALIGGFHLFMNPVSGTIDGIALETTPAAQNDPDLHNDLVGGSTPAGLLIGKAAMPLTADGVGFINQVNVATFPIFVTQFAGLIVYIHATVATTGPVVGAVWGWQRTDQGVHWPQGL